MKDLKFICVQPDDTYYTWQVHLWLESLKEIGKSDKAIVLVYTPKERSLNPKWKQIEDLYPEAEFYYLKDKDGIGKLLAIYIPVLRPYTLMHYFREHPERVSDAIMYCDSDVLFTDKFNIDSYIDDDINYLSDTNSYISASYFDSKIKDVLPEKLEEYKTRDILGELTSVIGISREIAELNNNNSGGAQYLLKNIDASFWEKVIGDCITIRLYLQNINKQFFKNEAKGFQSWCADMWAVLWNLWLREKETKCIPELEFSWAPDPTEKVERLGIYHNAGVTGNKMDNYPAFYKGHYHQGTDPFKDPHLEVVLNDEESKKHGTHYYVSKMLELKNKYNLNY